MGSSYDAQPSLEKVQRDSMALMEERARSYQIELFEYAKKNNTIVCLGTGTGKTFISVLLMKYLEHEVAGPWRDNPGAPPVGKRTIFLAPTVPLVEQQGAVLAQQMTVKVGIYVGSMNTDRWTQENWNEELESHGVLVMTHETCRLAIDHGFIPLENINLLVLDECHRATGYDPYVKIMENYKNVLPQLRPKVLGLTASVVNAQVQGVKVAQNIRDLEACLFSTAKTASQSVLNFGTKPTEIIVSHIPHDTENVLQLNDEKMKLLKDCADSKEFEKAMKALSRTYSSCGAFCAKELLEFRERELEKALQLPDCAEGFRAHAHIKKEMYAEIHKFLGNSPSIHDIPPKMQRLLEIIKQFGDTNLSAVVFVQERLVAYVLYKWMTLMSRNAEFSFVNCSFIVGQTQSSYGRSVDQESLKMNSKAQNKMMKDFRYGVYNLMFATSVIEEGMDVPACNLIVRFDPPTHVGSYTQSKGRARAKPSLYVVLSAENDLAKTAALIDSFQETEQLVMHCCGAERSAPTAIESFEILKEDPDLPAYIVEGTRARITAQSAISLVHSYCQQFMRMKYPNVFPYFDLEETPKGFVCTLTMPIVCPLREKFVSRPFSSKDKAKMFVALETCKRLHLCGELADNLLPRRKFVSLHKMPPKREDMKAISELKEGMVVTGPKSKEKRRYVLPRKQASILDVKEEGKDCNPSNNFHLYVIKTEVVAWAGKEQNWRGDPLFDPTKHSTWIGIIMKSESPEMRHVPSFPIFTRSGEEKVSFVNAGPLVLDQETKQLCAKFNRYTFYLVLEVADNLVRQVSRFHTPCVVPVKEIVEGVRFELDFDVLRSVGPAQLPDFENFVYEDEYYKDAVVELLYHLDENQATLNPEAHSKVPQNTYRRFYVVETKTRDANGKLLTPNSTGYYGFNTSLSFADYALQKKRRTGPRNLLKEYQPVMTVEHSHKRLQMLFPRHENQLERRQKHSVDSTAKYLIPQVVAVHRIKASLWRKITSLPSILHRLNRLLLAEGIRKDVSVSCRLKPADETAPSWPPMKFKPAVKEKIKETPLREIDALVRSGDRSFDRSKLRFSDIVQPDLKTCVGPSPSDIMQALTTKASKEIFDLERLELLGDSFLQIVATFSVLDRHQEKSISELSTLRQAEINNRHLLYRAHDKELTKILDAQPFIATHNFLPFGFRSIPHEEKLLQRDMLNLLIECFDIDHDLTPKLKNLRYAVNLDQYLEKFATEDPQYIMEMVRTTSLTDDQLPKRQSVPVKSFHDFKAKVGGDVVEALVGVYLEKCGPVGALRFFKWIGKDFGDTETNNFLDAFRVDFSATKEVPLDELKPFMHLIDKVEKQIQYTFHTKALVLQAITHHSCREHLLTEDNNKLAFIGEAVVDYLLTVYIYRLSSNFSPGQLTDLRCALINSQVNAHAIVRAELHTVLLYTNSKLFSAIRKYLENIDDIGLRLNAVLDDWETDDPEEAEVPRPLARILQAVMGAVFVDSGKCFETVWRVLVNIMGYEIHLFTNNVPLTPIRELAKMFTFSFSKPIQIQEGEDEGKFEVTMSLNRDGKTETYAQISETKKIAKVTLAKRYLRKLGREKRFQEIEELKKSHVPDENVVTISDVLFDSEIVKSKFYRTKK